MSYVQEAIDIETLFATEWAAGPNTPVEFDNSDFTAPTTGPYVTLIILSGSAYQADLGKPTNTYRHNGLIAIQIHGEKDEGSAGARSLYDAIAGIFRTRFVGTGIVTRTPDFDRVGVIGAYYQINVLVPFHRDTIL